MSNINIIIRDCGGTGLQKTVDSINKQSSKLLTPRIYFNFDYFDNVTEGHIIIMNEGSEMLPNFLVDAERFIKPGFDYIFPCLKGVILSPSPSMMRLMSIDEKINLSSVVLSARNKNLYLDLGNDFETVNRLNKLIKFIFINLPIIKI